ncbi:uncharacterized protein VDAG_03161 [Verticillium dahliae VdLs.17]|uniref:Uncharacterized protein n=1 Tax=Verticillium dahliae (strain VdLs.17 / ATCC MYA-4575 / FGSC 10137) TaxID=498257 RepID=G2WYR9_VERDV|nr:uncharacterized protein VDAG_03161 [Verticillium dahliae VdLs.17]EGY21721.1 hypothetical protein VDAG_03161 [Verticillium dahliae VdLs.17]
MRFRMMLSGTPPSHLDASRCIVPGGAARWENIWTPEMIVDSHIGKSSRVKSVVLQVGRLVLAAADEVMERLTTVTSDVSSGTCAALLLPDSGALRWQGGAIERCLRTPCLELPCRWRGGWDVSVN